MKVMAIATLEVGMPQDKNTHELVQREVDGRANLPAETSIQLGSGAIDLSGLNTEQAQALKVRHAEMSIDTNQQARQAAVDAQALDAKLGTMASQTNELAAEGNSVTMSGYHEDRYGRIEVSIGNSEAAKSGRLSRTQMGLGDNSTLWASIGFIVFLVAAGLVAVALIVSQ